MLREDIEFVVKFSIVTQIIRFLEINQTWNILNFYINNNHIIKVLIIEVTNRIAVYVYQTFKQQLIITNYYTKY